MRVRRQRHRAALAATIVALGTVGACSSEAPTETADPALVVALGDSYPAGYRPAGGGEYETTADNFPQEVATGLSGPGRPVEVANFACAGAALADLVSTTGCDAARQAPGAQRYSDSSQLDAALAYLQSNRGRVTAIMVVIGGNDLGRCFTFTDGRLDDDPSACVDRALRGLADGLTPVLQQLRTAAGPDVRIVGLTYPDVYLALYRTGGPQGPALAAQSLELFTQQLNPILSRAYTSVGGRFVDLTTSFDGTVPLTEVTTVPGYGSLPVAVGTICTLTYMCSDDDLHPTADGHRRIADAVLTLLRSWSTSTPEPTTTPTATPTATS